MAPRMSFEFELGILNRDLQEMGMLIEAAIDKVIEAFQNKDSEKAKEIVQQDRTINDMEHSIESRCLSLRS